MSFKDVIESEKSTVFFNADADEFAETFIFDPDGTPQQVDGIYDDVYTTVDDQGYEVNSQDSRFTCNENSFSTRPLSGVVVERLSDGKRFSVRESQPSGSTLLDIYLIED